MKVLYIHTGRIEEPKANNIQMLQMCRAFAECGQDVTLAVNSYKFSNNEASKAVSRELNIEKLPFKVITYRGSHFFGKLKVLCSISAINRLISRTEHDILFVRHPIIFPFLKTPNAIIFEAHNNKAFSKASPIDTVWQKLIVNRSRKPGTVLFISISKALSDWWCRHGVPESKSVALHDAANPGLFLPDMPVSEARTQLGISDDRKVVLYAGSLYGDRCIDDILKLAHMHSDTLFLVVGGPEEAKCAYEEKSRSEGIKNIMFTGRVPHHKIPLYLASADILLMLWSQSVPTINYCSPLKMFEYMAAGRTIVGHGFPTIREVLTHENSAYLADPASFKDLSEQVNKALKDSHPEIPARALELARSEYTWINRCAQILKHIEN